MQSLYNTVDSKQSTLEKQVAQRNAYISSLSAGSKELENENKKYRLRKTATIKSLRNWRKMRRRAPANCQSPAETRAAIQAETLAAIREEIPVEIQAVIRYLPRV